MTYIKKQQNDVPFQSGCNDQAPSSELEMGLGDLYELYSEKICDAKMASTSVAARKREDNAKAETLRNASLGLLTPQDKIELKSRGSGTGKSSNMSSATLGNSACGKKRTLSVVVDLLESASIRLSQRHESQVAREARKKEKQYIKHLCQEQEFNFKVEQAERPNELQRMQVEVFCEMLRFLSRNPESGAQRLAEYEEQGK